MSFKEKSQWIVLVAVLLVFGNYFLRALPAHGANVLPADIARFIGAIVALVILQVIGQALLAIASRREIAGGLQRDERDSRIQLRARSVGSHVLATAVVLALSTALLVPGNFAFMHVLFGGWVLSHVAELAVQLALYRRGG